MIAGFDTATILATTLENIRKKLIDNVSTYTALFYWLNDKGRVDNEDGGYQIREPLLYDTNKTIKSYGPGDHFDTERPSGFTSVFYEWSFVGGTITLDGPTEFMNSGDNAIVKLIESYIEQLQTSYAQEMSTMWYSDGTGNNGKDLLGMDLLVEDGSPSWNEVGGIDSAIYTWWKNYYDGHAAAFGEGGNCAGIKAFRTAIRTCTKLGMKPDLLIGSGDQYELYEGAIANSLTFNMPSLQKEKYADAGFGGLRYKGVDVMWDEHFPNTTDWLLLNSKAMRLVIGKGKAFDVEAPMPHPTMDAKIMKAKLYAQLTVRNRRDLLGRIRGSGA